MRNSNIDFVITWVDGDDPLWQEEKVKYAPKKNTDDREIRYRDWDNLQYWFRGVEEYAPWVNKIYFVTWGHLPSWLNINHPKLQIVKHVDYIPKEYLPTFNSHVIELNLHRIKGLSEQFVYFNDDCFILRKVKPSDFFRRGLPCDTCALNAISPVISGFSSILNNTVAVINKYFQKSNVIKENLFKWLNIKYGTLVLRTIALLPWRTFVGFHNHHLAVSYLKKTFVEVWEKEEKLLDSTCRHPFRSQDDVNQYIFRYWRLVKGEFMPIRPLGKGYTMHENNDALFKAIRKRKYKLVDINDSVNNFDFEQEKRKLNEALNSVFPRKSTFEN